MSFSAELRAAADDHWEAQHAHPFVVAIGDGTLDADRFRRYVLQDYVFLIDYGRLLALGAARAPELGTMARFAELAHAVLTTEMDLHRRFAASWGVDAAALEREPAAPATRAYCDFLLRTAALGDLIELAAALLPCMWGYAEIAQRLAARTSAGNPYAEWIAMYAGEEFAGLAGWCRELVDGLAEDAGPAARARAQAAFTSCSELELGFWEMAWSRGAVAG